MNEIVGVILLVLLIFSLPIVLSIIALVKVAGTRRRLNDLEKRYEYQEMAWAKLRRDVQEKPSVTVAPPTPVPVPEPTAAPIIELPPTTLTPPPVTAPTPPVIETEAPKPPQPPPLPSMPEINWEQFMGAKMFAWIGGFVLFLALIFFLKYAFENHLISPQVQVALEYVLAAGVLGVGIWLTKREALAVLAQTLCATGVLALYAVTFAAHSYYELLGIMPTFALMALVTATAFLLAVRLEAQVVAVLGLVGGFLTPVLLSTGVDNPLGLFSYIALLDVGLIAVALRKRWNYLMLLAALGTALMQSAWVTKFFAPEKIFIAATVFGGFEALFLGVFWLAQRREQDDDYLAAAGAVLAVMPFWFAFYLFDHSIAAAQHLPVYFAFVLAGTIGLLGLALWSRWRWLAIASAVGTVFLTGIWVSESLTVANTPKIMAVALGVDALFIAAFAWAEHRGRAEQNLTRATIGMVFAPVALALYLVTYRAVAADRPALFFGYLLLVDAAVVVLVLLRASLAQVQIAAGGAVFAVLACWTGKYISESLLYWSLGMNLFFGVLHAVFPVVWKRRHPDAVATGWWQLFPLVSLALVTFPILRMPEVSWVVWLAVLLLDAVIFVLAMMAAALVAMIGAIVFTLGLAALWICRVPVEAPPLPGLILVIGGFAVFFFVMSLLAARKLGRGTMPGNLEAQLPAFGAVLPFALLMMVLGRLTLENPSPVFGLALLLVVLLLGVVQRTGTDVLSAVALGCVWLLELIWRARPGQHPWEIAVMTVAWNTTFYAVFLLFPFVFLKQTQTRTLPWAVAAMAGPLHLWLMLTPAKHAWPWLKDAMGLMPALFAVPTLGGLVVLLRRLPAETPTRNALLAWFGGVALFFITVIFPMQFHRQWITVAWALEGAALLWLFHRVPHKGLCWVGLGLLVTAFVRLALNPSVLVYHAHSTTPIFNWYLYAYGITTASLFATAHLATPREGTRPTARWMSPLLATLGTILAFLLLNIEIADYFTAPGAARLTFKFSGNFTRDMTYSIAWALFALALLVAGIWRKLPAARWASIGLLVVTLAKLFLHDLARLNQLYRIGAFVGVAVVLLLASFAYQRFLARPEQHRNRS